MVSTFAVVLISGFVGAVLGAMLEAYCLYDESQRQILNEAIRQREQIQQLVSQNYMLKNVAQVMQERIDQLESPSRTQSELQYDYPASEASDRREYTGEGLS